ncbi:MAG: hypothetical protein L0Z62_14370 [Gemmataceae bacterium]|nr:hypothetical protein [Gemmataceae bacterium]
MADDFDDTNDIDEPEEGEVPEGATVFPLIPEELGVNPLLLAALHASVFLIGSDETVVHPDAAAEALQYMVTYLQRLSGPQLQRVREDVATLADYARQDDWPKQDQRFLKSFLSAFGIGQKGGE